MIIRVVPPGEDSIDFYDVTSFKPDVEGYLMADELDGCVFFNRDYIQFFRVMDDA